MHRAYCCEFPNDNPLLGDGSAWLCAEPTGPLEAVRHAAPTLLGLRDAGRDDDEVAGRWAVERVANDGATVTVDGVRVANEGDSAVALEGDPTEVPAPVTCLLPPPIVGDETLELDLELESLGLEADLEVEPVSGPVTFAPAHVDEESAEDAEPAAPTVSGPPPAAEGFASLVDTIVEVAFAAGAPRAATALPALLSGASLAADAFDDAGVSALVDAGLATRDDTGLRRSPRLRALVDAWQAVLDRGDFSGCGAETLVEWAADVVAAALGSSGRAQALQYELRRHGVAAFGLVRQAA